MHRRQNLLAAVVFASAMVLGAAVSPSLAQTSPAAPGAATSSGTAAPTGLAAGQTRAKGLIDRDVYSSDDVEIGEVEDLILDAQGRVVSAVIEVEGRLGFTDKYVAVPYDQLRHDDARRRINLPMSRDQLRALPGFRYQD
ncbi:PRC-barrel domain-containing protein [Roseicella sp. DB1501]|uniref:PRC-barrel domain-containing protein n=1 Tax=Roseicella sp. DB1501 TaxID=2730925 RepID=UPI001491A390|nr:PRC-barrel domain-containing protein [Roseicella sp. DB1501]NOG74171.1 PRC-barrel domain-containing protein [Roseicella sp. DB1501]